MAVIAVDPSSPITGGALLGDRVRMQAYADDGGVFIRSMASRGHAGGLASTSTAAAAVLDAAGFDLILIETVGTGQSEVEVAAAADTTVVLEAPEMGDEVQAIKAGLLEVADLVVVNKGDKPGAQRTAAQLRAMLVATAPRDGDPSRPRPKRPEVLITTAATGDGVPELRGRSDRHRAAGRARESLRALARAEAQVWAISGATARSRTGATSARRRRSRRRSPSTTSIHSPRIGCCRPRRRDRGRPTGPTYHRGHGTIERVFVAGAGLMGHGIAQVHAAIGLAVTLYEPDLARAEAGRERIAANLDRAVAKGKLETADRDATLARIEPTADLGLASPPADLVIEAVFEDLEVKSALWRELDALAPTTAIFASNTSSISIDRSRRRSRRAERAGSSACISSARCRSCRSSS